MNNNIEYLNSPLAVRDSARRIFELASQGRTHFTLHPEKLSDVVNLVLKTTRENYPDLNIPFHSRWSHFNVGSVNRLEILEKKISQFDAIERARIKLDLVVVSVLLDAGAGMEWRYQDRTHQQELSKSEGLAVASLDMFLEGLFSSDGQSLRVDSDGLKKLTNQDIEQGFQVNSNNPLKGVQGRLSLLHNLADCLVKNSEHFPLKRPGSIIDYIQNEYGKSLQAADLLKIILNTLGDIWPGRLTIDGKKLGDVWRYQPLDCLLCFHKLSQWLTYSLIEPIEASGIAVENVNELTGLAEYRNGGLLLDTGLIQLKDMSLANIEHSPESDLILEWRALTVYFLDLIAQEVRRALGKTEKDFPTVKVLEGGTWWAGRIIAKEKRSDGGPPLNIVSDGTVF